MRKRRLHILLNWVLLLVPIGFMWFLLAHQYPQMRLDLHDYLTLFRWGHL